LSFLAALHFEAFIFSLKAEYFLALYCTFDVIEAGATYRLYITLSRYMLKLAKGRRK